MHYQVCTVSQPYKLVAYMHYQVCTVTQPYILVAYMHYQVCTVTQPYILFLCWLFRLFESHKASY